MLAAYDAAVGQGRLGSKVPLSILAQDTLVATLGVVGAQGGRLDEAPDTGGEGRGVVFGEDLPCIANHLGNSTAG